MKTCFNSYFVINSWSFTKMFKLFQNYEKDFIIQFFFLESSTRIVVCLLLSFNSVISHRLSQNGNIRDTHSVKKVVIGSASVKSYSTLPVPNAYELPSNDDKKDNGLECEWTKQKLTINYSLYNIHLLGWSCTGTFKTSTLQVHGPKS